MATNGKSTDQPLVRMKEEGGEGENLTTSEHDTDLLKDVPETPTKSRLEEAGAINRHSLRSTDWNRRPFGQQIQQHSSSARCATVVPNKQTPYGTVALYDKYVPDIESYVSIQKPRTSIYFPLDFPKPVRPDKQKRSKPSTIKKYGPQRNLYGSPMARQTFPLFGKFPPRQPSPEQDHTETEDSKKSKERKTCWDRIKCSCCKKKKKEPMPESDESVKSGDETIIMPPDDKTVGVGEYDPLEDEAKGVRHYVSESRHITTYPSSQLPASPKEKPKRKKKTGAEQAQSSVSDASNQPIGESSRSLKGILKSSEERVRASKSLSITPSERDAAKTLPEVMSKQSTVHFRSEEISTSNESVFQPSSAETAPKSPAKEILKKGPPSPTMPDGSPTAPPPLAGAPPQKAAVEDSGKGPEEATLQVGAEMSPPKPPSPYSADQATSPTKPQLSSEKTKPTSPSETHQAQKEAEAVPITSLRNQRRAHFFARASAPSRRTIREKEEVGKSSGDDSGEKEVKQETRARPPPQHPAIRELPLVEQTHDEKTQTEPLTEEFSMEEVPLPTLFPEPKSPSPKLTRESRLHDVIMEGASRERGTVRFSPVVTTTPILGRQPEGKKSAPLPGAKWVHKFFL
ncbi:proteoglycan 4-like isoform X2 [Anolis carolinensis]|uniref:proteoglycan 4-like isoform X2 n=1 Tax=Anolis carolinensis TaxID=28377 RepID=UPI002F2B2A37